jgi:hypothetical protein
MNEKRLEEIILKRQNHEDINDNTTYNHITEFLQDLATLKDNERVVKIGDRPRIVDEY